MSNSNRRAKREPRERPFPYVPHGLVVVSKGPANGAEDNQAYVRALLAEKQPEMFFALYIATQLG